MKHYLECEAPICKESAESNYKHELVWYAGEKICQKTPYEKFQKKQLAINKEVKSGKFRHLDVAYNAHDLETRSI